MNFLRMTDNVTSSTDILRQRVAAMRELGVVAWKCGSDEITLGPPPPKVNTFTPDPEQKDSAQEELQNLLHSSGGDASVLIAMMEKANAS